MSTRKAEAPVQPRDTRIPCCVCANPLGSYVWGGKRYCGRHTPPAFRAAQDRAEAARAAA